MKTIVVLKTIDFEKTIVIEKKVLLTIMFTIVNKGSSLTIVNEGLSLTIVNGTKNFIKTVVFGEKNYMQLY